MKTLQELIRYHSKKAEQALSMRKRMQHRHFEALLLSYQRDLKLSQAKTWLKNNG